MLIKLDEDLPRSVAEPLAQAGHEIRTVYDQGWAGTPDADLWQKVVVEGALFVTADKGFGDLRTYPPGEHPGIVVLRTATCRVPEFLALVQRLAAAVDLAQLRGCTTVVSPAGVRIRRADPN